MYDLLVFIGRFQPFHNEHKRVLDAALAQSKNVLVLVGSSYRARTPKNPFSLTKRADMIYSSYEPEAPIFIEGIEDFPYDDVRWAEKVRSIIKITALDIINDGGFHNHGLADMKIGIIGAKKDDSSFYLDMFPEYPLEEVEILSPLNATDIRRNYLWDKKAIDEKIVPYGTYYAMQDFAKTEKYSNLAKWQEEIEFYKTSWESAPYPVKHVTADAVVEYRDHILLVQRGKHPGKGLWAVPGGHVNVGERVEAAALRELREETVIPLTNAELKARIVGKAVFDDPDRSTIGHVITHAVYVDLSDLPTRPVVTGADDAAVAVWVHKESIYEEMFYDDHWHIIQHFIGD